MGSRRWWALAALAVALLAFGLDVTVLSVALPTLAVDLHASTSDLQWFSNAYTLVLAAGLVPAGLLGDKFGPKRLLLAGLTVFGLASGGCAYAGSAGGLIAARAILGLGAALMVPLSMSMLTVLFAPRERARAISVWAAAIAIGIPLGPVAGGWLLDHYWWGSVFLINVPLVAAAIALLAWLLPDVRGDRRLRIDFAGIGLSSSGLALLTYGLVAAGEHGWSSFAALLPMAGGVVLVAAFVGWQRRAEHPLVDLAVFASPAFLWGSILATLASFALVGSLFLLPQYLQAVFSTDALGTGLRLLPVVGGLLIGVPIADRIRPALDAKVVVAGGFVLMAAGLVTGTVTDATDGYGFVAGWVTLIGVGLGLSLPPAMDLALAALGDQGTGVGSGLLQALRQVGGTIGVAILGTVFSSGYRARVDVSGLPARAADAAGGSPAAGVRLAGRAPGLLDSVRDAVLHGMSGALWVCALFAAVGAALSLAFLPSYVEPEAESEHDYVGA